MRMINICGIPHTIVEKTQNFSGDIHFGEIDFAKAEITLCSDSTPEIEEETLCHEIIHGIPVHIGRTDLNDDETFVTSISNAINQSFKPKEYTRT